ncbi:MAG: flavodoxin family protein [Candidatus Methylomirabilales bacterium]
MKITAIVGSYRRGGIVESAVDELLGAARAAGADVEKVNLLDRRVEFCANCRACTLEPGLERGTCPIQDDVPGILDALEQSDAFILASPMNFGTVTALMKRFIERTVCYGYWPWGGGPKDRGRPRTKRAVLVVASAAPAMLARWTTSMPRLLKQVAGLLGAGKVQSLWIGLVRATPDAGLSDKARARARRMGVKLASQ